MTVFRFVCRMRFSEEIVLAILVQLTEYPTEQPKFKFLLAATF